MHNCFCSRCEKSFVEQYQLGHHLFRQHKVIANGLEAQFPNLVYNNQNKIHSFEEPSEAGALNNNNTIVKGCISNDSEMQISEDIDKRKENPILVTDLEQEFMSESENNVGVEVNEDVTYMQRNTDEAVNIMLTLSDELVGVYGDAIADGSTESAVSAVDNSKDFSKSASSSVLGGNENSVFQVDKNGDFLSSREPVELDLGAPNEKPIRFPQSNVMMNDEDSLTDGSLSDNTRFMLRGDPSLHRCQSGDDLFMLSSVLFADDKESDIKSLDRSRMSEMGLPGYTWSSSNLSALVPASTPHKLSVDPGASSVNVSPSMSPFRASIGQGESDSEDSSQCLPLKIEKDMIDKIEEPGDIETLGKENLGGVDKESSVSPGHTDSSTKFPLQPDTITFKKSPETSTFEDFEKIDEKPSKRKTKKPGRRKSEESSSTSKRKDRRNAEPNNKRQRGRTKGAGKRRKSVSDLFVDDEKDTDWSPCKVDIKPEHETITPVEKPKKTRTRTKSAKQKEAEADAEVDAGLEYNLRPKRRKTFQSLFHDGCECCMHSDGPVQKSFNVQHYMENVNKVEMLRKQVTQLIGTVFPDLKFPPRFSGGGIAVEYLMNEVTDAASERQRIRQGLVPFGTVDGDVKVVLCKYPLGCLRHFRRKISRLLKTLLPDINSKELEVSGATVDDLLTQVIATNSTASVEQSEES